jgi:tetratricopeptide (TPR) repeat protein
MAVRELPPDSFERSAIREFGNFQIGVLASNAIPVAAGDYVTVRNKAEAAIKRSEALKPATKPQELLKIRGLVSTYFFLADASYNLKDYAAADSAIKLAIDYLRRRPMRTLQDERDASDLQILAAMIAARLGNAAEAHRIVEPALKLHRGLYARGGEELMQRVQLARALYASALAGGAQKSASLKEAATLLDGLPPAMRQLVSTALLRGWIAEEQKKPPV